MTRINWRNKIDELLKKYNRRAHGASGSNRCKSVYIETCGTTSVYTRSGNSYKDFYIQLLEELCLNNKYS